MANIPLAKRFVRLLLPGPWHRAVRLFFGWRWFRGDYRVWAEARAASQGYEDSSVLARVVAATREVVGGRAAWDRDGATFITPAEHAPLLEALRRIGTAQGGRLEIVDFGGALGSTWRQYRAGLSSLHPVCWRVVEQPHYVEAGREFADEVLSFYGTLEHALAGLEVPAVLLSGVLQYIGEPHALLAEVARRKVRFVVLDRTSFAADGRERITIQRTPAKLGGGSYPCWLFSSEGLLAQLGGYRLVSEWPGFDDVDRRARFAGFLFERLS